MKHESKTVHVDERPSFAGSLVTIFAGQGARAADSKTTRENLPGKSRVGRILLNDNNSQDRLLGMKLADISQMQRKAETFISHQQKTFLAKMEKRQDTWVREHIRFSNSTNLIRPHDDEDQEVPPTRETYKSFLEGVAPEGVDSTDAAKEGDGTLPAITYLTEGTDNSTRNVGNGATIFAKEPDPYDRAPKGFVGLPPITHAKKSGFAPSGNIDDMFDDSAMKRSQRKWPPVKVSEGNAANLPVLDPNEPRTVTAGKESKMSAIIEELEECPDIYSPKPQLLLSRSLPLMQLEEPQSRRLRARREHQPKVRRKRSRNMSDRVVDNDNDNPLADDRFLKLHDLLASEVVADHESRELSAIARGFLAAKRFGQSWKK